MVLLIFGAFATKFFILFSANKSWKWHQLQEPVKGFLKVSRTDANCGFVLAVSFPLTNNIERLTQLEKLPPTEKTELENKFRQLCAKVGASEAEADDLLRRLTIRSIPVE